MAIETHGAHIGKWSPIVALSPLFVWFNCHSSEAAQSFVSIHSWRSKPIHQNLIKIFVALAWDRIPRYVVQHVKSVSSCCIATQARLPSRCYARIKWMQGCHVFFYIQPFVLSTIWATTTTTAPATLCRLKSKYKNLVTSHSTTTNGLFNKAFNKLIYNPCIFLQSSKVSFLKIQK